MYIYIYNRNHLQQMKLRLLIKSKNLIINYYRNSSKLKQVYIYIQMIKKVH